MWELEERIVGVGVGRGGCGWGLEESKVGVGIRNSWEWGFEGREWVWGLEGKLVWAFETVGSGGLEGREWVWGLEGKLVWGLEENLVWGLERKLGICRWGIRRYVGGALEDM